MNVLASARSILLYVLDRAGWIILGKKDILVTEGREGNRIEDHSGTATRETSDPAIAGQVDAMLYPLSESGPPA